MAHSVDPLSARPQDLCPAHRPSPGAGSPDRRPSRPAWGLAALTGAALAALGLAGPVTGQEPPTLDDFDAVEARNIGPGGMSGRVAAVAVDPTADARLFVGASTGGVFRSVDGGLTWEPVFDDELVLGIGHVAISPANPDVVWVGTGEGNPRNSVGVGYGIWKSIDGGDTWRHLGLEGSERIHRVIPHPTDPDVAFVAAMGPAWSDSEERGVFRTTDGGATWERLLFIDERTGAADLVMDPANPDKLLVGMWDFRREPWFFTSGGPGSGLYVSLDGGESWTERTEADGLPPGELGRIGLAVAPSDPEVVYALVEAERSELLRSDDGGESWRTVSDRPGIVPRPFYYADLRVDPLNENRIYSLHGSIQVSEDAGRTFRTVVPSAIIHGDVHELWIDPDDPRHMIIGNDGGIGITWDRGDRWRFVENLVLAQYYRVAIDDATPFNVYGGLQDNGSWYGPMTVWENKGIQNAHWRRVGGGDGFHVQPDWSDDRYGYSMSQQGSLQRFDKATGARESIQPVHPEGVPLRFNWNAGFAQDPHDSTTIYLGSQFVHRSPDQGASWEIISPDLTTNDPAKQRQDVSGGLTLDATGAENHTTITDIAPSPLEEGVIWVGTDDGRVQITRDGGATWTDVGADVPDVPDASWVADVEPSRHDPAVAYLVYDEHRRGDWTTYAYRTSDYGRLWERLPTDGVFGFAHDLEEDPVTPGLLFLGTEFGLYVSVDRGATWGRWTANGLPPAPVRESVVHPRDGDLVVSTHGRGIWIVDDVRPLRAVAAEPSIRDTPLHLFEPPPAVAAEIAEGIGYRSTGHAMMQGETRPRGGLLTYWVAPGDDAGGADVEIRDTEGRPVTSFRGPADAGANRVVWNLRAGEGAEAPLVAGSEVLPGRYQALVRVGDDESAAWIDVRPDPRRTISRADRIAKLEAIARGDEYLDVLSEAQARLRGAIDAVERLVEGLDEEDAALLEQARSVSAALEEANVALFTGPPCQGICGGETVADDVRAGAFRVRGSRKAPTPLEREMLEQARAALGEIVTRVNALFAEEVAELREAVRTAGHTPLPDAPPLRLPVGGSGSGEGS